MTERPFDEYRLAITDPLHFFGRRDLLDRIQQAPFHVRILLGGRRLGKTSVLRAVEWHLLDSNSGSTSRAFPVFVSLEVEQPQNLSNLRYILITRLREAIDRWRQVPWTGLSDTYRRFLRQVSDGQISLGFLLKLNISNPDRERQLIHDDFRQALLRTIDELGDLGFEGITFLLDEAEFIVRRDWANDAWSYLRGLKDTDTALKPFVGFILSGYRDVKEYEQRVGSSLLGISKVEWLTTLTGKDALDLISHRAQDEGKRLSEIDVQVIMDWAGRHPFLTQQMLNTVFNHRCSNAHSAIDILFGTLVRQRDQEFSAWWNVEGRSDGFGPAERTVYASLVRVREGTAEQLREPASLSLGKTMDALEVLVGTGVIQQDEDRYTVGPRLFEEWLAQQDGASSVGT
jgi:hypothetical protein